MAWTIIATASFGFVRQLELEVVLAEGELQPLGAERPVKAPFSGVIKNISVKEGQKVRKGDTLLRFDPEVSRKRKETLEVQLKLEKKRFEEESRSIREREQSVRAKRDGYARSLETEQEIYENIVPLAEIGATKNRGFKTNQPSKHCNPKWLKQLRIWKKCRLNC